MVDSIKIVAVAAAAWRGLVRRINTGALWLIVWLTALAVPFVTAVWLWPAAFLGWLSAMALAPGRHHGRRLLGAAAVFAAVWGGLIVLINLAYPSSLRPAANLAVWIALGLNLILAKTPLELALSAGRFMAPIAGRKNSRKLALALALMARLIPRLLSAALLIRTTIGRRAGRLPLTRRMSLWAATLLRETMSQNEEIARALLKRWPWNYS